MIGFDFGMIIYLLLPKRLVARIEKMESEKVPLRKILEVLKAQIK